MAYTIPTNVGLRLAQAGTLHQGLLDDAVALKITQITAEQIAAQIAALTGFNNDYNAGRTAIQAESNAVQDADADLATWIAGVKSALTISFGQRWNVDWVQVGFITPSLGIPVTLGAQVTLANSMVAFLTKNPSYEVPTKSVTAAYGTTLLGARTSTRTTLKNLEKAQITVGADYTTAFIALGDTMWLLVRILQKTLGKDDPRWKDFGLPLPGTPSTPGQPQNLTAHLDGNGAIVASCDPQALAVRYRFRLRILGVEQDYRLAGTSKEPLVAIPGVMPGQTVEMIVQAVNGNLQSVASEPIVFTVPLPVAKEEEPTPKVAELTPRAVAPSETVKPVVSEELTPTYREILARGNGNGHTNGSSVR